MPPASYNCWNIVQRGSSGGIHQTFPTGRFRNTRFVFRSATLWFFSILSWFSFLLPFRFLSGEIRTSKQRDNLHSRLVYARDNICCFRIFFVSSEWRPAKFLRAGQDIFPADALNVPLILFRASRLCCSSWFSVNAKEDYWGRFVADLLFFANINEITFTNVIYEYYERSGNGKGGSRALS